MNVVVIKIGGLVAQNTEVLEALLAELASVSGPSTASPDVVLVHGGGKEVTAVSTKFGFEAEFRNGIRLTSPGELDVVDMVLGGKLNIDLVRRAQKAGLNAVGLGGQDGALFTGEPLSVEGRESRTGKITDTDPALLVTLLEAGYFPILHSTSMDAEGQGLNINADEAAQEVAISLKARTLLYISDIPGVLKNGAVLPELNRDQVEREIAAGTISGGMIPKVTNALAACERGVGEVLIGGYEKNGDLERLLTHRTGTSLTE